MQKFFVKRFFNPTSGLSNNPDVPVEQPKQKTSTDVANEMQWADGKINHGSHQPGEMQEAIRVHNDHAKEVQKQAQVMVDNPDVSADIKQWIVEAQQKTEVGKQKNTEHTRDDIHEVQEQIVKLKNSKSEAEWNHDGTLKLDSLIGIITDLDDAGGVEVSNRGAFKQALFGWGDQHEAAGEAQMRYLLQHKTQEQIDAMYTRLTGDSSGLRFNRTNNIFQDRNWADSTKLNHGAMRKIRAFRKNLLDEALANAAIIKASTNNPNASAGLSAAINGNSEELRQYFLNPENIPQFEEALKNGEILKQNPNLAVRMIKILTSFGLQGAARLVSGAVIGVRMENSKITNDDLRKGDGAYFKKENMTLGKKVWENGSIEGSLDLAGLTVELNWNDPESTMKTLVQRFSRISDKSQVPAEMIKNFQEVVKSKSPKKLEKFNELSQSFEKQFNDVLKTRNELAQKNPNDPRLKNFDIQLEEIVMNFTGKTLELRGTKLQWVLAVFWLSGLAFGVSAAKINTSYSSDKINLGAAELEARANQREINQAELESKLTSVGIIKNPDGSFSQKVTENGKEVLKKISQAPNADQKVIWNIEEVVTDKNAYIKKATPKIVPISSPEQTITTVIRLDNREISNEYITKNSQKIVDSIQNIKLKGSPAQKNDLKELQQAASKRDLQSAENYVQKVFSKDAELLKTISDISDPQKKMDAIRHLLAKTSGGVASHELANRFDALNVKSTGESYDHVKKDLKEYYQKTVSWVFAQRYGLNQAEVNALLSHMIDGTQEPVISTLGQETLDTGFVGMVAYSQKHGFRTLDPIDHSDARIFGIPKTIQWNMETNIRAKLRSQITPEQVQEYREKVAKHVKEQGGVMQDYTDEQIRDLMVAGPVKSYLSYEENAECFNLGFFAQPGMVEWKKPGQETPNSTINQGATVLQQQNNKSEFAVTGGFKTKEKKKDDSSTTEPEPDSPAQQTHIQSQTTEIKAEMPVTSEAITNAGAPKLDISAATAPNVLTDTAQNVTEVASGAADMATAATTEAVSEAAGSVGGSVAPSFRNVWDQVTFDSTEWWFTGK